MIELSATTYPRAGAERIPYRAGVVSTNGVHRVIAMRPIDSGTVILELDGVFVDRPSKYSVQLDDNLHIEVPLAELSNSEPDRHPWRFLNHSCDPNATLVGLKLIALKPIREGDEITFDYNTTEYEISNPFTCRCGTCGGSQVRGFRFLPADRQRALYPRLAGHLRRRIVGMKAD